ncbi:MAG: SsrA-binding protein SmpB [Candidatus Hydrogenedentota bacterium]|nr:MAG: SsrA-binding protein SmpB [Candidatus Hydrogenedentota bacterium]
MTLLADNRIARHRYFILERITAGIALLGCEVKSIRAGRVQLRDAFVRISNGEAFLLNCHISPYPNATVVRPDPTRTRKLLLRKSEIRRLEGKVQQKGLTLIPLKLFLKRGLIKVEVGLCRGKEAPDKREVLKKRAAEREMARALSGRE